VRGKGGVGGGMSCGGGESLPRSECGGRMSKKCEKLIESRRKL